MFRAITLIAALACSFPALAAQQPDSPPAAPTQTMQVSKALALANAISAITGDHEEVIGQGSNAKVVQLPYDLSADTRWALNDDFNVLNALIKNAQSIQKAMMQEAETKNGGPLKPKKDAVLDANGNVVAPAVPSDAQIELNKKLQGLLDGEKPVAKLFRIKRADLKLGTNSIPGATLSILTDPTTGIVDP